MADRGGTAAPIPVCVDTAQGRYSYSVPSHSRLHHRQAPPKRSSGKGWWIHSWTIRCQGFWTNGAVLHPSPCSRGWLKQCLWSAVKPRASSHARLFAAQFHPGISRRTLSDKAASSLPARRICQGKACLATMAPNPPMELQKCGRLRGSRCNSAQVDGTRCLYYRPLQVPSRYAVPLHCSRLSATAQDKGTRDGHWRPGISIS